MLRNRVNHPRLCVFFFPFRVFLVFSSLYNPCAASSHRYAYSALKSNIRTTASLRSYLYCSSRTVALAHEILYLTAPGCTLPRVTSSSRVCARPTSRRPLVISDVHVKTPPTTRLSLGRSSPRACERKRERENESTSLLQPVPHSPPTTREIVGFRRRHECIFFSSQRSSLPLFPFNLLPSLFLYYRARQIDTSSGDPSHPRLSAKYRTQSRELHSGASVHNGEFLSESFAGTGEMGLDCSARVFQLVRCGSFSSLRAVAF